jgi:hypothetical protein
LLTRGAFVNADLEDGTTALYAAGEIDASGDEKVSERRVAVLELLIARGANVNARDDRGRTPLHVNAHDPKAAAVLLAHHADVNGRDGSGSTPLHYLATSRSDTSEAMRVLLDHGAEVDARDHSGYTPLLLASTNLPLLETLIAHGAAVKVSSSSGRTPLHEIARSPSNLREDFDVLAILCSAGLRPDVADRAGATPLGIARAELASDTSSGWRQTRRRIVQFLSPGGPCNRLARSGTAVTKEQRAFIAAELECPENDVKGCENLAWFYDSGEGVEANKTQAAGLYDKACGLGSQFACTSLAFLYEQGQGVAEDPSRAAALYGPACEAGQTRACFNLAFLYATGRGVAKNGPKAIALFRRACDGGDAEGCKEAAAR